MNARTGSGWQTVLADLSLILFMITAAAVSDAPAAQTTAQLPMILPALGEPVAVWRAGRGGPDIAQWLAAHAADPRLRLTIIAPVTAAYPALQLARVAKRPARIVLEPLSAGALTATLTYDRGELAQRLQNPAAKELTP